MKRDEMLRELDVKIQDRMGSDFGSRLQHDLDIRKQKEFAAAMKRQEEEAKIIAEREKRTLTGTVAYIKERQNNFLARLNADLEKREKFMKNADNYYRVGVTNTKSRK